MKRPAKLFILLIFAFTSAGIFLSAGAVKKIDSIGLLEVSAQATPPANANTAAASTTPPPSSGNKEFPKEYVLSKDSVSEYGESPFNHENHALKNYSPDGKSVVACIECHHTDQPKSALKPPLSTSQRDVALTLDVWKTSTQKVNECRTCHFQDGNIPEGKTMPSASYTEGGKTTTKVLNNELAYHINCNTCHDAAALARPEVKKKAGFATSKDCTICHKPN